MRKQVSGIHHITAIVGHPQENVDFYAGVLGLRLVKTTVNFDDPGTYHFYFGNENGKPGTLITFFPWARGRKGEIGDGQVGITTYVIPTGALAFWQERLTKLNVSYEIIERFGEKYLQFSDPHGLKLELVEREEGENSQWEFAGITADKAIKGFGGAVLFSSNPAATGKLLTDVFGFEQVAAEGDFIRYRSPADLGNSIDIKQTPIGHLGRMGVGTVHHIALRAQDDEDLAAWQDELFASGFRTTTFRDRHYFKSIYFREHGAILFEMATDPPGFMVDESFEELGTGLKLPPQYEPVRDQIESVLLPFEVREPNID